MSFFNNMRLNGDSDVRVPASRQAQDLLNGAAMARDGVINIERDRLSRSRDSGGIACGTTDEAINIYASNVGFHHQATSIVHNPPSSAVFFFLGEEC